MFLRSLLKRVVLPWMILSSLLGFFYISNISNNANEDIRHNAVTGQSAADEEGDPDAPRGVLAFRINEIENSVNVVVERQGDTSFLRKFAPQYINRAGSCQKASDINVHLKTFHNDDMTISVCEEMCTGISGSTHFAMANGAECRCLNSYGSKSLEKYSACDTPCPGDPDTFCGSDKFESIFKIERERESEPPIKYSPWTTFHMEPGFPKSAIRRRFSGCDSINYNSVTECDAALHTDLQVNQKYMKGVGSRFIGCFTDLSFNKSATFTVAYRLYKKGLISSLTASACVSFCKKESASFAITLKHGCFCSNTLGWAQPIDGCQYFMGAAVFTTAPVEVTVRLKFEKETEKAKVAVIAHYRGGSTFSLQMFDSYPGALTMYEPDYVLGSQWSGVSTYWREEERSHVFLDQIMPYWFDCKQDLLPGVFTKIHIPTPIPSGMEPFHHCRKSIRSPENVLCLNFLKETCLRSPLVVFKTVRILAPLALEHAILQNPDVHLLYVSRDPRGQMASRMKQFKWFSEDPVTRLDDLCTEMIKLEPIFHSDKYKNAHITFYEEQALDAVASVKKVYGEMGLVVPKIVEDRMLYITGKGDNIVGSADSNRNFGVIRSDASKHVSDWVNNPNLVRAVKLADRKSSCSQLFKVYEDHYVPFVIMRT